MTRLLIKSEPDMMGDGRTMGGSVLTLKR
ncbi:hypothetical protein BN874_2140008 [Candidatus Contendobacter odensis Run_B_J11]|uniref:Uncharacterized protein n=1 Tax=Candidatus Contendobacter odensis Run_B_J11 TaxID=1400861 RepID=A0A7U7GB53_9GAMM|nr:hypothetical protein BN874_2140008 [Candidatus Contendobacter odensis Run_B_J11]